MIKDYFSAFQHWEESPVVTTIETLPIRNIHFPKISVCPPKGTYTNLNYDLLMTENMTLSKKEKDQFIDQARILLHDANFKQLMENVEKVKVKNQYKNWYLGIDKMTIPHIDVYENSLLFDIDTWAKEGLIETNNYDKSFQLNEIPLRLRVDVYIHAPIGKNNTPHKMSIHMKKNQMKSLTFGHDDIIIDGNVENVKQLAINRDITFQCNQSRCFSNIRKGSTL